ncbi:MAG TPA: hypothetical protein VE035_04225 [Puia sp.]|nr:hypothetical protein [Puia sp.]
MKTSIKDELHKLINNCNNESTLEEAKEVLQETKERDWWDDLTEEDQSRVLESEAQYERGEFITHDDLMRQYGPKKNL